MNWTITFFVEGDAGTEGDGFLEIDWPNEGKINFRKTLNISCESGALFIDAKRVKNIERQHICEYINFVCGPRVCSTDQKSKCYHAIKQKKQLYKRLKIEEEKNGNGRMRKSKTRADVGMGAFFCNSNF